MIKKESKNKVRSRKHLRVRAKVSGTSTTPRLCVFRSNKHIEAQVIDDVKQVTLVSVSSLSLHLENGSNITAASKVGEEVAKNKIDLLITVGDLAKDIAKIAEEKGLEKERILTCNNNQEAIKYIKQKAREGDAVLLKASNGLNFQEIYTAICD